MGGLAFVERRLFGEEAWRPRSIRRFLNPETSPSRSPKTLTRIPFSSPHRMRFFVLFLALAAVASARPGEFEKKGSECFIQETMRLHRPRHQLSANGCFFSSSLPSPRSSHSLPRCRRGGAVHRKNELEAEGEGRNKALVPRESEEEARKPRTAGGPNERKRLVRLASPHLLAAFFTFLLSLPQALSLGSQELSTSF